MVSNYFPLFYVDVITYSCPNPDDGVTNPCWKKGTQLGLISSNLNWLIPKWLGTLVPDANIYGMDEWLHGTIFCGT